MNHLDEIRAKLSIEELVGGYIQLKKAGRNLKGLCPFHNDSRPSFMVSPEKGIAYCFSCNTGGDIFKFIQLTEKVDFPEAVKILADRVGVRLPSYKPEVQDEKRRILKANELTCHFFQEQLKQTPAARAYFEGRGLSEETLQRFSLGFSPDSFHYLKDHLKNQGFNDRELLVAGLLNQRSMADNNTYDRFRGRLMFPIHDHQGNVVGFGGRITGDGEPKYLNSPDTPVYNKSYVLYGLHLAKEAIKQNDLAILTEGYMDVITAHQAGSQNVIATSGTALTTGQLRLLKRYTKNVALAFDQDQAGMEATKRAVELAKEADLEVKIIMIPDGKDPDECIKHSKNAWFKAIDEAIPVIDFYFSVAFNQHDKETLEGRKAIAAFLLPIIKLYPTKLEQNEHLTRLAFELKTDVKFLWDDMQQLRPQRNVPPTGATQVETPPEKNRFSREAFLLGFIFNHPAHYPLVHQDLIDMTHFDPESKKIYTALKKVYDARGVLQVDFLNSELEEDALEQLKVYGLLVEQRYSDVSDSIVEKEILSLIRSINLKNIRAAQKEYEFKIRSATSTDERSQLLRRYNDILKLSSKLT